MLRLVHKWQMACRPKRQNAREHGETVGEPIGLHAGAFYLVMSANASGPAGAVQRGRRISPAPILGRPQRSTSR